MPPRGASAIMTTAVSRQPFHITSPSELTSYSLFIQLVGSGGARAYLAVSGGLDVPAYLGSRATFPGGKLGGTQVQSACS